MLTELSKVNAPSMLLSDFNYFFNKAINQYINKRYNIYDINQQTTDDLRVLKSTCVLDVSDEKNQVTNLNPVLQELSGLGAGKSRLFGAIYEVDLPTDYLHMLNCVCIYQLSKNYKCYDKGNYVQFSAKRLTADSWSTIVNDYYNRPLPERPYYYIHHVNSSQSYPYNPSTDDYKGTDVGGSNTKALLEAVNSMNEVLANEVGSEDINNATISSDKIAEAIDTTLNLNTIDGINNGADKEAGNRYGNATRVRMEIRYGHDNSIFKLKKVFVDYIKAPLYIRLTQEQVNLTEDTSQVMEFPDYVCQEIINELTTLVMENTADPRLQTNIPINQSIALPVQQLSQPQQSAAKA